MFLVFFTIIYLIQIKKRLGEVGSKNSACLYFARKLQITKVKEVVSKKTKEQCHQKK